MPAEPRGGGELPTDLAMLVILPETLRQRRVPVIGDWRAGHGFRPVGLASVRPRPDQVDHLYQGERSTSSEAGRVHGPALLARVSTMDSSVVVMLRRPADDGVADRDLLHRLKGPSAAPDAKPGTPRWLSPIADRCLSLAHNPDDAASTVREIELLLHACRLPGLGDRLDVPAPAEPTWADVERLHSYRDPGHERSRNDIAMSVLGRLLTALGMHVFVSGRVDVGQALRPVEGFLDGEPHREPRAELSRYLNALSEVHDRIPPATSIVAALERGGLALTDYEQQWLEMLVMFFTTDLLVHRYGRMWSAESDRP